MESDLGEVWAGVREGDRRLLCEAKEILERNWRGTYTVPSSTLYPHQWSWDSAFIAQGYSRYDQKRAQMELLSLFRGQWRNGMLPHIIFDPEEKGYFPGPEVWKTHISPEAPRDLPTSGITQPPIHAAVAWTIYERAKDREGAKGFLRELFPKLLAFHRYLYRERDPMGEGLVYIRHPWESGMDNSPVWDGPLGRIKIPEGAIPPYRRKDTEHVPLSERPKDEDYERFIFLLHLFRDCGYMEDRIFKECPFVIQGNLFNAILHRSNRSLYRIAEVLREGTQEIATWMDRTRDAFNSKLWDREDGFYYVFDMKAGGLIKVCTAAGFVSLFGGLPTRDQADRLYRTLDKDCFCRLRSGCYAVPNYDVCQEDFSPENYWRGPIWININWLIYQGLKEYGNLDYATYVRNSIVDLVRMNGFYEYYDPFKGRGHGTKDFSWTAALLIDVVMEELEVSET